MHNISKSELHYWLAFYLIKGIGFQTAISLLDKLSFDEVFDTDREHLDKLNVSSKIKSNIAQFDWAQVDTTITQCQSLKIDIIYYSHPLYPELLKQISNPPLVLFCLGDLALLAEPKLEIGRASCRERVCMFV